MTDTKEHYDREYDIGSYVSAYEQLPVWAGAMNQWHVDFVTALLSLAPDRGTILDLGSGMGHYLTAWESRGFKTRGIEISEIAIRKSGRRNIYLGDACDLRRYRDDEFQLVFSAAFLEHIDDSQVWRLVSDEIRIAKYAVHFIAHDKGNDPGHINIKSPAEWMEYFSKFSGEFVSVANPLCPVQPAFLHMRELPPQIAHAVQNYTRKT